MSLGVCLIMYLGGVCLPMGSALPGGQTPPPPGRQTPPPHPSGRQTPQYDHVASDAFWEEGRPPVDRVSDTRLWKHNLCSLRYPGGKNIKSASNPQIVVSACMLSNLQRIFLNCSCTISNNRKMAITILSLQYLDSVHTFTECFIALPIGHWIHVAEHVLKLRWFLLLIWKRVLVWAARVICCI